VGFGHWIRNLIFEDFVNLPTCTILEDGLVNGKPASEVLDLIVSGFHCHTYGNITVGKNARPILISHAKDSTTLQMKQI